MYVSLFFQDNNMGPEGARLWISGTSTRVCSRNEEAGRKFMQNHVNSVPWQVEGEELGVGLLGV